MRVKGRRAKRRALRRFDRLAGAPRRWRSSRRISRLETISDHVGLEWREAVEADRGIGRRVSTRSLDHDLCPNLKRNRQQIWLLLVQDVDRVATRPRDDAGAERVVVKIRADRVADHFVLRFGKAIEPSDVEEDPTLLVVLRFRSEE